jgi:mono/diheme cytochrome c family protein
MSGTNGPSQDKRAGAMIIPSAVLLCILLCVVTAGGSAAGEPAGKQDFLGECSGCHGADGKGGVPEMSAVPGYISVDLTQLSNRNGGQFPRQEVYDAIDGRKRFPAHFIGDMPTWGLKFQQADRSQDSEENVKRRIAALVDYVESLQEKPQ